MPVYNYTVHDSTGTARTGATEAENPEALSRRLTEQGFRVENVWQVADPRKPRITPYMSVPLSAQMEFWLPFSTMLDMETPLLHALKVAADGVGNENFRRILRTLRDDVSGGKPLSDVMERYPKVFDRTTVGMIRAGETSGALSAAVHRLVDTLETERQQQRQAKAARNHLLTGVLIALVLILLMRWLRVF